MIKKLRIVLEQYKLYWKFKKHISNFFLKLKIYDFLRKEKISDSSINFSVFREIVNHASPFIWAVITALLLYFFDEKVITFYDLNELSKKIDEGTYSSFLTTIAGIGGVFIGLYYAAISTICSAVFNKVPSNIQHLVQKERKGNTYMFFLSFITFLALALISANLLGLRPIYIAIPLFLFLSAIAIFAFINLGKRAFFLLDPTTLKGYIQDDISKAIKRVSVNGYRWKNTNFQDHARRITINNLSSLEVLTEYSKNESHARSESYFSLIKVAITILIFYTTKKILIPSESHWFEKNFQHSKWYKTPDTETSIAAQAGITLFPKDVVNPDWFEDRILKLVFSSIPRLLKNDSYQDIIVLIRHFDLYLNTLVKAGNIKKSAADLRKFSEKIINALLSDENHYSIDEKLSVVDHLAALPIS